MSPGRGLELSIVAAAVCLGGCQLVFGLGDYETDAGGTGGEGATNVPGDGGAGAMMTVTTGPSCECGLDPIWTPVTLADQGDAASPPGVCADQSSPINVFYGEKPGMCSSCTCSPSGCASPGLECFTEAACQGTATALDPGSGCGNTGTGFDSCRLAGEIVGACDTAGGQPVVEGPPFEQFLSFCGAPSCELACEAECITTAGVPAGGCPGEFAHHYQLPLGGTVACDACTCSPSCGDAFSGGTVSCDEVTINGTACSDVSSVVAMYFVRSSGSPSCSVNHAETYAGTVQLGELQTVCCKAALPGVTEN